MSASLTTGSTPTADDVTEWFRHAISGKAREGLGAVTPDLARLALFLLSLKEHRNRAVSPTAETQASNEIELLSRLQSSLETARFSLSKIITIYRKYEDCQEINDFDDLFLSIVKVQHFLGSTRPRGAPRKSSVLQDVIGQRIAEVLTKLGLSPGASNATSPLIVILSEALEAVEGHQTPCATIRTRLIQNPPAWLNN